jgi:hypothetical protein
MVSLPRMSVQKLSPADSGPKFASFSTTRLLSVSEVDDSASAAVTCARRFFRTPLERVDLVNVDKLLLDKEDSSFVNGSMAERSDETAGRRRRGELRNDNS